MKEKGSFTVKSLSHYTVIHLKRLFFIINATIRKFSDEEGMHLAAGVAYYVLLSIFPMALLFISILSFFQEPHEITDWLIRRFGEMTPELHDFLEQTVERAVAARLPAGILGFFGVILSSTLAIAAIMRSINRAWGILGTGYRNFFRRKLWEFSLLLGIAIILLLFYAGATMWDMLSQMTLPGTEYRIDNDNFFWNFLHTLTPFSVMAIVLLILYKYVPATEVKWRDIWIPSLLAALALKITNELLGWYFNTWGYYHAVYGSITGVIVLLLWAYICANIVIAGAALCSVLTTIRNQSPDSDNVPDTPTT